MYYYSPKYPWTVYISRDKRRILRERRKDSPAFRGEIGYSHIQSLDWKDCSLVNLDTCQRFSTMGAMTQNPVPDGYTNVQNR